MFYEGHDIYSRAFNVKSGATVTVARFVKQDGLGGVTRVTASTDPVIGVAMEEFNPTGGALPYPWPNRQGVRVRIIGSVLVEASEALTYGDQIKATADGRAAKATGTDKVVGEAFTTATQAGEYVLVFLKLIG